MWPVWAELSLFGRSLPLTGYGLFAILGAALGTYVCVRSARRFGFPAFDALASSLLAVMFGVVGAKVLFVLVSLPLVREQGWRAVLGQGGLVWFGGVIGGGLAALAYLRAYRLDVARFADAIAPGLAVGHAVGRLGCVMAGCCYGSPTDLPWGLRFPASPYFAGPVGVPLHPVQIYEGLGELGLAALAWWVATRGRPGAGFVAWLTGYGALRVAMEVAFRGDDRGASVLGWPVSVVLGVLAVGAGMFWLVRHRVHATSV